MHIHAVFQPTGALIGHRNMCIAQGKLIEIVLLSTVTVRDLLHEFVQYGNMTLMEYISYQDGGHVQKCCGVMQNDVIFHRRNAILIAFPCFHSIGRFLIVINGVIISMEYSFQSNTIYLTHV